MDKYYIMVIIHFGCCCYDCINRKGHDSMKCKGHFFWTFLYIGVILYFIDPYWMFFLGIWAFMGLFPDTDLGLYKNSHRWIWFHSIIIPVLFFVFFPHIISLIFILVVGHHLLLDVLISKIRRKQTSGTYTLCLLPHWEWNFLLFKIISKSWRLNGKKSTIFYLMNFVMSLLFIPYYLIYVV